MCVDMYTPLQRFNRKNKWHYSSTAWFIITRNGSCFNSMEHNLLNISQASEVAVYHCTIDSEWILRLNKQGCTTVSL